MASGMTKALAPVVRSQFAKRLKVLRAHRGFERARYFAQSLGIEENRYTRYERAEVEPNLTLIYKMCETLKVTPNELLGFAEVEEDQDAHRLGGFAEAGEAPRFSRTKAGASDGKESLAWRLAAEVVALHREMGVKSKSGADPLKRMQDTGTLYRNLQSNPFGTVAEILSEPALNEADAARKADLAELIEAFTSSIS
jgi:transcriptional regulator with XRE-family HTH domain